MKKKDSGQEEIPDIGFSKDQCTYRENMVHLYVRDLQSYHDVGETHDDRSAAFASSRRISMYSYGSSARTATGKQGHGGRNYRPPPNRKEEIPPPLKQCNCLIELDLPDYRETQDHRTHDCFGGRDALKELIKTVRSKYLCHLEIPGRSKSGPVGLVGATIHHAILAARLVLHHVQDSLPVVEARIHRDVKMNEPVLEGAFRRLDRIGLFFESESLSIAAYILDAQASLANLNVLLENLQFHDATCQFDVIADDSVVFALGQTYQVKRLLDEINQTQNGFFQDEAVGR